MLRYQQSSLLPPRDGIDNFESLGGIPRVREEDRTVSIGTDYSIQYNHSDANAIDITHLLGEGINTGDVYESIMETVQLSGNSDTLLGFQDPALQKTTTETNNNQNTLVWVGGIIVLLVTALIFFKWRKTKKRLRRK